MARGERMDAAFEVAVAGEHGGGHEFLSHDGRGDGGRQRAAIAYAGSAAIGGQMEAEGVERGREPGGVQVVGDHLGAGGKAGLDPGFCGQPTRHGLLRQQARSQQHGGVGGIGATGDGRDDHIAVGQNVFHSIVCRFFRRRRVGRSKDPSQVAGKGGFHVRQGNGVLGPFGPGQGGGRRWRGSRRRVSL